MIFLTNNKQTNKKYRQDPLNALMCYPTWRNLTRGHLVTKTAISQHNGCVVVGILSSTSEQRGFIF